MKYCLDCFQPISVMRTRCHECQKLRVKKKERERYLLKKKNPEWVEKTKNRSSLYYYKNKKPKRQRKIEERMKNDTEYRQRMIDRKAGIKTKLCQRESVKRYFRKRILLANVLIEFVKQTTGVDMKMMPIEKIEQLLEGGLLNGKQDHETSPRSNDANVGRGERKTVRS